MNDRFKMAVASHLILENPAGEILMLRRANTGYADGCWSLPAGHVEPGETLADCCAREAQEEIGVHLDVTAISGVLVQHKRDGDSEERVDAFFTAQLPDGAVPIIGESHKCDAVAWFPREQPPVDIVPYISAALGALADGRGPIVYFGF